MILKVHPTKSLSGRIELPSSKSYSIRAALIAACGGASLLKNYSDCDDACVALDVVRKLGAKVGAINKNNYQVLAKLYHRHISAINVNESGTTLRFLLPLLALKGDAVTVKGKGTLIGRPNTFLVKTLRSMGAKISGRGNNDSVPIKILESKLRGGRIKIDGSLSSQFISALFITCPQLEEDTLLELTGKELVSGDYITMTVNVLKETGVRIKKINERKYFVAGLQEFHGLKDFIIPSDYGLAAFLLAAASLVKSNVTFTGHFNKNFIQADGAILNFIKKMGVRLKESSSAISLKGPYRLKGGTFSLKSCPDLVPIMAVLALFAQGKTRLVDIKHARAKESDRISDLRRELLKIGADIREDASDLTIYPRSRYKTYATLDPHNDHRLAMAFAVLGLKIGVAIKNIRCTHKSYPSFVKDFKAMGAKTSL